MKIKPLKKHTQDFLINALLVGIICFLLLKD